MGFKKSLSLQSMLKRVVLCNITIIFLNEYFSIFLFLFQDSLMNKKFEVTAFILNRFFVIL